MLQKVITGQTPFIEYTLTLFHNRANGLKDIFEVLGIPHIQFLSCYQRYREAVVFDTHSPPL